MAIGVPPQNGIELAPEAPTASEPVGPARGTPAERPPRVFYRIDSRRVTLREYWWGNPASVVPAAMLKLFRVRISSPSDDPCVETLAPFEVEPHQVPGLAAQRLAHPIHQLTSLGFRSPIWHVVDDDVQQAKTYLATFVHASGRAWARVHSRIWLVHTPPTTKTFVEIVSETAPGRFLWSMSCKADLAAPSSCTIVRKVNATPPTLWAEHQAALQKSKAPSLVPVTDADALRASVERHHAAVRAFHVQRGVFAPLTADEHATAQSFRESVTAAQGTGSKYPEILAEIDRLQQARSSGKSGLILLVVSLGLFVLAATKGTGGLPLDMLVILVGVLFVHELGHWLAMRVFGYRNLKMFFIPFFGAAVSGRHYNVPGWKKAIVSFAGPLPGIVLGAAIGFIGAAIGQPLLVKIGVTAVALNGFNLLPVLPLDGGWILQAILLSRHHLIELLFRVGAIVVLVVTSALTKDPVTRYLAIFMAVALPAMHKQARITNELRKSKLPPVSDDDQTIPPETAEAIVAAVKARFPKSLTNKNAAQYTLQIFENLNARPPGLWASLGLGALQLVSLVAAAVIAAALYLAMGTSVSPR
ncbi:MAG TPA: site-2 protease family protein [Gemmatimonadaceae bacterium]|nr:site-2 protease family protein [Gemmatimonadaceae bacterium]